MKNLNNLYIFLLVVLLGFVLYQLNTKEDFRGRRGGGFRRGGFRGRGWGRRGWGRRGWIPWRTYGYYPTYYNNYPWWWAIWPWGYYSTYGNYNYY